MIHWLITKFDKWWLSQINIGRIDDGEDWWKGLIYWIKYDKEQEFYITERINSISK